MWFAPLLDGLSDSVPWGFGKSVSDISLTAVSNLEYAEWHWLKPVYPGDTLRSCSEVIGLKQNSNGKSCNVRVRTVGLNQAGDTV